MDAKIRKRRKSKMKVKDVMSKAITADVSITIRKAASIISQKNIGSLVITKDGKLVGIVTEKDISDAAAKKLLDSNISRIMSKNVVSISASENLEGAAKVMAGKKIKRLPVTENDKLIGVISASDIIANSDSLNDSFLLE